MAMTYVCLCAQQAKDHAKMRIREVKSRLKQKVLICFPALNHLGVLIMNYNDGFPNLSFLTLWPSSHSMQPLSFFSFSAITTFTFVNFSFSCVPPPPLQEQAENGLSTEGSAVTDDDSTAGFSTSTGAARSNRSLQNWEECRPVTMHLGQVGKKDVTM